MYRAAEFDQKPLHTVFFTVFLNSGRPLSARIFVMAKTLRTDVNGSDADGVAGLRFEAALEELEKLVAAMEAGQLPLEESLAAYRRGAALLQHCQGLLADAEEKIRVLDNGVLRPLAADDGGDA